MSGKYCGMEGTEAPPAESTPRRPTPRRAWLACCGGIELHDATCPTGPGPLTMTLEREIATQTEVITCRLTTFEGMRRLNRQQFRELLRGRLQEFGDLILTAWEQQHGQKSG